MEQAVQPLTLTKTGESCQTKSD